MEKNALGTNSKLVATNSKNILGLVGSPRKLGNCEIFIKETARSIKGICELKLIRMPSMRIEPCLACYGCIMDKPCPHQDDLEPLLQHIVEADAVIIASPIYFLGSHSIFKRILDRGFLFYTVLERTFEKPCALINFYGMKDRIGVAPHTLMSFASFLGLDIRAHLNIRSALPGEVLTDMRNMEAAEMVAEMLFGEKRMSKNHGCPFCGCEIVRLGKTRITCTLCHGTFKVDGEGKRVKIKDGGIFGPPAHMLLHKAWLKGMKEEFLKKRKEILRLSLPYKDKGEWIRL
jgi:NAD(P)H-dependent FMN reductase/ribosomal protein L37AE/L43A